MSMSSRESYELAAHVRRQATAAKKMAEVRAAELLADFEQQVATTYRPDDDELWRAAEAEAERALADANAIITRRSVELGIPAEFAPSLMGTWFGRGQNATKDRVAELRRVARTRLDAMQKAAKVKIESESLQVQTELLSGRLTSTAARKFLNQMPTAETLMPQLEMQDIQKRLGSRAGHDG